MRCAGTQTGIPSPPTVRQSRCDRPRWATLFWVLADFVCSVQPGAADGVAFDGGDHVIEGEELEGVGMGPV